VECVWLTMSAQRQKTLSSFFNKERKTAPDSNLTAWKQVQSLLIYETIDSSQGINKVAAFDLVNSDFIYCIA